MFVGALVAAAALREGLRRMGQSPIVTQAKSASRADKIAALFLFREGLYRLGSWALGRPRRDARA